MKAFTVEEAINYINVVDKNGGPDKHSKKTRQKAETVARYYRKCKEKIAGPRKLRDGAKILLFDIETAPGIVRTHSYFKANHGASMVVRFPYMLCWSAKWFGQDGVLFDRIKKGEDDRGICESLTKIIEQSDMVVAHNGKAFDTVFLNARLAVNGLDPVRPVRQYDTCRAARQCFRFSHNSLEGLARSMGIGKKLPHRGDEMWKGCEEGDKDSWDEMEAYNINDVLILEGVYERLRAFDPRHPNLALFWPDTGNIRCPRCQAAGTMKENSRGCTTSLCVYPLFKCKSCGSWLRGGTRDKREPVVRGVI